MIGMNSLNLFLMKFYSAYHCKCIDPWLTRNRRVCPVCKRRVLARGEQLSESESENSDDETRPLLRPGSYGTQGGTFIHPTVNSLRNDYLCSPLQILFLLFYLGRVSVTSGRRASSC